MPGEETESVVSRWCQVGGVSLVFALATEKRIDTNGLEGAIPAALLALAVQGLFELAERFLVPRGLRLRPEG